MTTPRAVCALVANRHAAIALVDDKTVRTMLRWWYAISQCLLLSYAVHMAHMPARHAVEL